MERELQEIDEIFKKKRNIEDDDRLEELNQSIGTFDIGNSFIKIEYHSLLEKYRAIKILEIIDEFPDIYRVILDGKEKIVFSDKEINSDKIICFSGGAYVNPDTHYSLLCKMIGNSGLVSNILQKMKNGGELVSKDIKITLLKQRMLNKMRVNGIIDFFNYLNLVKGAVSADYYAKLIAIDLAFDKGYYALLKMALEERQNEEFIELICYLIYEDYALDLMNDLLEFQNRQLNKNSTRFLKTNLVPISHFFNDNIGNIFQMYQSNGNANKPTRKLTLEEIIKEVREILSDIDSSQFLVKMFDENVKNGKIILWDKNDTESRKTMYQNYNKNFNIDSPMCYSSRKGDDWDYVVNIPLNYTVSDVVTIVHEMLHLNSFLHGNHHSTDLDEFPSIFFEDYARRSLMKKGYDAHELYSDQNGRIYDTLFCYSTVYPTIFWLNLFREKGKLNFSDVDSLVRELWYSIKKDCESRGLTKQETDEVLEQNGLVPNIDACTAHVIEIINNILIMQNGSVLEGYLYILGMVLSNTATKNHIGKQVVLDISNHLCDFKDFYDILKKLGVDVVRYGLVRLDGEKYLK